jgi:hypothetical protein
MPRVTIIIQTDNAAFVSDPSELSRILHKLADETASYAPKVGDGCSLFDYNGNRVGIYTVEEA